jgi:cell wall-associated NlpC family hydrolase
MRRSILGPFIFALVLGLIGANFGYEAQAQTTEKKASKHISKKHASSAKAVERTHKAKSAKKSNSSKKKIKAAHSSNNSSNHHKKTKLAKHSKKSAHHQKSLASYRSYRELETIDFHLPDFPEPQPSDLWLAKDLPETYRQMVYEGDEPSDGLTIKILESAYSYLGSPYRYGGTTPNGFDCSGFVRYVFNENGVKLGRSSREQALEGVSVPLSDLRPGDLIFFKMHRRKHFLIDHVGLYVGNGQFIHAASSRSREIKMESLESEKYLQKVVETRRVLDASR